MATLSLEHMDLIFRNARTHNGWQLKPVGDAQLRELYDLIKLPVQARLRRACESDAAQSTARVRRSVHAAVTETG